MNAGYAADGYARVNGISALITTFGVGELSAVNAIAGAYAEHVPIIHIVGIPAVSAQNKHLLLHHTLGNGDFQVFYRMSQGISEKVTILNDVYNLTEKIDETIKVAKTTQRPVYIGLPTNIGEVKADAKGLETPIDFSLPPNDPEAEDECLSLIVETIEKAQNPIILVDACASRHNVIEETRELCRLTKFPVYTTPMGKSVINEDYERYGGVYVGSLSSPEIFKAVEESDLIISIGALLSDFNTGSFTYHYKTNNIIEFHSNYIGIRKATYQGVRMGPVLKRLVKTLEPTKINAKLTPVPPLTKAPKEPSDDSPLKHEYLWPRISGFLKSGDIIISETGTSSFGITATVFPSNVIGISQVLWGSIGYSVGCTLGAALAAQEIDPNRRVILFVGDGSLQLTVTAISTMIRWNLHPYLFVLNNNGYTIERLIHGPEAGYNDIQPWKHQLLLTLFNAKEDESESLRVNTKKELDTLFKDEKFNKNDKIRLIELMLERLDSPASLIKQGELTSKTNAS